MLNIHVVGEYLCQLCSEKFTLKNELKNHTLKAHAKKADGVLSVLFKNIQSPGRGAFKICKTCKICKYGNSQNGGAWKCRKTKSRMYLKDKTDIFSPEMLTPATQTE